MNKNKIWAGIFAGAALSVLSACLLPVGDGAGLDANGDPIPAVPVFVDTNLTYVYQNVFVKHQCSGCHAGATPSGSMNLSSVAAARAAFFTIAGSDTLPVHTTRLQDVAPYYRVVKGKPDSSMLYNILQNDPKGDYPRMPYNNPNPLTEAKINIIRRWIEKGASLQ